MEKPDYSQDYDKLLRSLYRAIIFLSSFAVVLALGLVYYGLLGNPFAAEQSIPVAAKQEAPAARRPGGPAFRAAASRRACGCAHATRARSRSAKLRAAERL